MSIDSDYSKRLELLAELMEKNPNTKVRKLQREALKYYPLMSKEGVRNWMKIKTAFSASKLLDKKGS